MFSFLKKVYIEKEVQYHPYTQEILTRLGDIPTEILTSSSSPPLPFLSQEELISWGKQILFLTSFPGRFFRPCPGTKTYHCCGYKIFHIGQGCPLNCTYCILQAYFNEPWLTFFVNVLDEGIPLLKKVLSSLPQDKILRIGTGEFTDSMALDPITKLNPYLVELFSHQDQAVLELKTKTINIENLQGLSHQRRTIISWSLNTKTIAHTEELGAPDIEDRLKAAQLVSSWGYPVGFHFDPLIYYPGCEEEYQEVVARIFHYIPADNIVWISLGSLRYMPWLKEIALKRFPHTKIYSEEFIIGLDGKKRYFRSLREKLYKMMYHSIRDFSDEVCVYLCMESPEIWKKVFGFNPLEKGGLPRILDQAAKKVCLSS